MQQASAHRIRTSFRSPAWRTAALAAGLALALAALTAREARAADCAGGTARRIGLRRDGARYVGTVTYPGASHDSFVRDPAGFSLTIVDAADDSHVLLDVHVPAASFHSTRTQTSYDASAAFRGRIRLRNERDQRDTVRIDFHADGPLPLGPDSPSGLRAFVSGGETCTRSCVSPCAHRAATHPLACRKSAIYEPFADAGFGSLVDGGLRQPGKRSALCGLRVATGGPRCDFLIDEQCLLPYPSSVFLDQDPTTPTGLRVHYDATSLPANNANKHIDPTDWNTLDGFSPGPMIEALFPDTGFPVDLLASGAAFYTNYARSLAADHPSILMRADDGERIVHFAEMDATSNDVKKKILIVRPGKRLDDATRYLVAFRGLVDTLGTQVVPRLAFRVLRDAIPESEVADACGPACAGAIEARRAAMEDVFQHLAAHGVPRPDLVLAWDFTTASTRALTGWMVSVRDQAAALGTPSFTVTSSNNGGGAGFNANIYARIQGTFQAPLFMTADAPASRLNLINGTPVQNGYATVPFVVDVPRIAVDDPLNPAASPTVPARATLWGHGLLGNRFQLGTLSTLANRYDFVIGAVDMQGMSDADLGPAVGPSITDFSLFHFIPERLHQGFLHHLLLGRLFADPVHGFNSDPAFHLGTGGAPVIDSTQVFYSGGSQGGIFGGAIMGVSDVFQRGFLAVPAANYSTLLQRSIDFLPFVQVLELSYPNHLDQMIGYNLTQQLWDRAEPQGYLPHILSGDLSTPAFPHDILVHMATYDCEVSNVATEIMVRSLGIPQVTPVHRSFFDIPETAAPLSGSAFVEVDPQRGGSRCHTPGPGSTDKGASCSVDADCPGVGDPASRTQCASGIPPRANLRPAFNNNAHGSTGNDATGAQIAGFLANGGTVQQFCAGTCDPD